jgi:hypothetical protein
LILKEATSFYSIPVNAQQCWVPVPQGNINKNAVYLPRCCSFLYSPGLIKSAKKHTLWELHSEVVRLVDKEQHGFYQEECKLIQEWCIPAG